MDQYYHGSHRAGWVGWEENQRAGVQYVIDTVVQELAMDQEKRYIQAIRRNMDRSRHGPRKSQNHANRDSMG